MLPWLIRAYLEALGHNIWFIEHFITKNVEKQSIFENPSKIGIKISYKSLKNLQKWTIAAIFTFY